MKPITWIALLCFATACGSDGGGSQQAVNRDTLTERQKDSILAKSKIPGARAVGNAMTAADSTSARIRQANAVATDTMPR
ncbi:MAG TPA: hypothetical protein VEK86_07790 [Gemmatimonadales bacterium]|jgi:hypothetical protein|nr:hypothetical protein [Gemmatimonadales bacterium]